MPEISIIVPVLNDEIALAALLEQLSAELAAQLIEIIVVDGGKTAASGHDVVGSSPDTIGGLRRLRSAPGRAKQMNLGAASASAERLCFLHADSVVPEGFVAALIAALQQGSWGSCNVRLDNPAMVYRCIAWFINHRSRLTKVSTGDQCLFMGREFFQQLGGFANIPLMEDIEFCKRARQMSAPVRCPLALTTSSRRWEKQGVLRTVVLMWWLRWRYFCGASPQQLAAIYYPQNVNDAPSSQS